MILCGEDSDRLPLCDAAVDRLEPLPWLLGVELEMMGLVLTASSRRLALLRGLIELEEGPLR